MIREQINYKLNFTKIVLHGSTLAPVPLPKPIYVKEVVMAPLGLQERIPLVIQEQRLSSSKKYGVKYLTCQLFLYYITYFKPMSSSSWASTYTEPQYTTLLPWMTLTKEEATAMKGAVPPPQSMLCLTPSLSMTSPLLDLQQSPPRHTISPHSRQRAGSWGTLWHTTHTRL